MTYRFLRDDDSIQAGTRRIARDQIDKALGEIDDPDLSIHERVHQVRKRCKKVRALVRLTRGATEELHQRENAFFRDLARTLSEAREAHAAIECLDEVLRPPFGDVLDDSVLADLRRALVDRRDRLVAELDAQARLDAARGELLEARERIGAWEVPGHGFAALAGGLRKTYKRARNRWQDAQEDPSGERIHTWRKRTKYHRYHCKLLREVWAEPMMARRAEAHALTDLQGDHHDLVDLAPVLDELGLDDAVRRALAGLSRQRRDELARASWPLGARLFAEEPDRHVDRIGAYWHAWQRAS